MEFKQLLKQLDFEQQTNLAAHLYSAYLIETEIAPQLDVDAQIPHKHWTAWPEKNAPKPDLPVDDAERSLDEILGSTEEEESPESVLARAVDKVFQKTVYKRLHAAGIEPTANDVSLKYLLPNIIELVDKRVVVAPPEPVHSRRALIGYKDLHITNKQAIKRLNNLFPKPLPLRVLRLPKEPENELAENESGTTETDENESENNDSNGTNKTNGNDTNDTNESENNESDDETDDENDNAER